MTSGRQFNCQFVAILLALSIEIGLCNAAPLGPQLYWGDTGYKIQRANLDGSSRTTVVANLGGMNGIAADRGNGYLFWSARRIVSRSTLDGTDVRSLFDFSGNAFGGEITVDELRDQLYFVDAYRSIIYRSGLDGSNVTTVVPTDGIESNVNRIFHLWLDPYAEKLYWTHQKSFRRSSLETLQEETLFTIPDFIRDFQVDILDEKIYWATSGGSIRRADFDGTNEEVLLSGFRSVNGLALDVKAGKMYFSDNWNFGPTDYDSTIRVANLDGSGLQTILNLGPSSIDLPIVLTLDTLIIPEPSTFILLIPVMVYAGRFRQRRRSIGR